MNTINEVKNIYPKEKKIRHGEHFTSGICCPSIPISVRDSVYKHFGYTYTAGTNKQPIAFWILINRLLEDAKAKEAKKR